MEKAMAPHFSILAWKIPWTEEPARLQSMGLLGVGHDWVTSLSLSTFMHGRRIGNPLQCSCLENPRDWEAWWAAIYGVAQSQTRLTWLSSSSISETWFFSIYLPMKNEVSAVTLFVYPIHWTHHKKCQARWVISWNQDRWEKHLQTQIMQMIPL